MIQVNPEALQSSVINTLDLTQDWQLTSGLNLAKFTSAKEGLLFADTSTTNQSIYINSTMDGWGEQNIQNDGSASGISNWGGNLSPMKVFQDQFYYLATHLYNSEVQQNLRLINSADAPTLETNGDQTLKIADGQNLALYNFTVGENQQLDLSELVGNSPYNTYRIFDEFGNKVVWETNSGQQTHFYLRQGKYTFVFNRGNNDGMPTDGTLGLNFNMLTVNDDYLGIVDTATQPISYKVLENATNNSSIEVSQDGFYQITMQANETISATLDNYLGLGTNWQDNTIQWDAEHPTRLVYLHKGGNWLHFNGVGDVTLTVNAISKNATVIVANTAINLNVDATHKEQWFSYQNADASGLSLQLTDADSSQYQINVFDGLGQPVWQGLGSELNGFTPASIATQLYIQVNYLGTQAASATLQLNDTDNQSSVINVVVGELISNGIASQSRTFTLDKPQVVWLSSNSQNFRNIRIIGERGEEYNNSINSNNQIPIWLPAGNYQTIIEGNTEEAQFTLTDSNEINLIANPEQGVISLAENQTTNVVKVNLDKDKITTFAGIAGDYQGSLNVYDKYGKLLVSKTNSDTNAYTLSLNYSGEYYIAFNRSSSTAASTVNFGIKQIPQATASTPIPLALNTTTNVAISDMNQTASYQFTVADISYLDLTLNGYLMAEVYDSQQNLVQTLTSYTSKTLLAKGDYTLKVKPTYSYYYYYDHTITANLTAVQPLTQDAPVTIAADPKGGYRYLAINLEKGQRYAINYAVPNYNYYYGSGNVSLYDGSQLVQSGTISASSSQNMAFTAPHSGTFYVQVPANIGYTGIYSLVSGKETDLNYEVGTSYNGGNIAYQDQVNHHFEITKAGKYLLSDYADRNYNYLNLSLVDANGQVTNITNQTQLLDLAVGSYTLQVKKNANYNTGYGYGYVYGFTLKDVTTLDSLMLDTPTTTSTPDARSAVAWKISGTKGENVLIDARTPNTPYENWLLFNQNGQQVTNYNTYYNNDHSQKITLPEAGDYYLVSYGDYYRTKNRADYPAIRTVTISNFESHNQAITLNQQVTGQLPAGDTQNFTFSLDVEKNIGFAIRSGSYNIRLYGPNQQADVITLYPDDHNLQNYYLAPGDYRIEITGYGSTTPSYDFKLLDTAAQAQALSNNSGTLTATIPANQTQVSYALAVQAGQAYQLNFPNTNYYAATYKVVDEQGRTLVNNTNIGDYRNFTPSATGNVYLVVNKNQAIIAQDFNVNVLLTQSVATSVILTLGETASTSLHTAQDATKYQLHITNTGYYQFCLLYTSPSPRDS